MSDNGWRSIETAPKNGPVALFFPHAADREDAFAIGYWISAGGYWWLSCVYAGASAERHEGQPTHWMPLPQPPAA